MTELGAYLDHNATTPVRPAVREAMRVAFEQVGNPSSVHRFGALARRRAEDARAKVASLVNADPQDVVFTSGGTEANNLAITGLERPVLVSAVEHDSVLAPAREVPQGFRITPVDSEGIIDLDALDSALAEVGQPALVSVMLANNETGVIQPLSEVARTAHARGALLHCDAVQGAGRITLDLASLGADLLTLSAHKLGGPMGVGALILAPGLEIRARATGGAQEMRRRAGTENLPGIAGFGVAADLAAQELESEGRADLSVVAALRDGLEQAVSDVPGVRVYGAGAPRVGNTSCFSLAGVSSETQVMALDLDGVAISAGAACSSGKIGASHVLSALGVAEAEARCAIRVSLGAQTERAHIDRFLESWFALVRRTAKHGAAEAESQPVAQPAA
ncbi:MAG: cysteine desulfurase [Proteobacteria bacterium]|nr:cysteine desulfurase [Pseudomonadota bacterium]